MPTDKNIVDFVAKEGQTDYTHIRWAPVFNSVVYHKDKILLIQRNKKMKLYPGYWSSVSGFLDDDKSLEEKVEEELEEELSIASGDVESLQLCDIFDREDDSYKKTWIVHAVKVVLSTDEITLDWEGEQYQWIDPTDAQKFELLPGYKKVLEKCSKRE